MTACNLAPRSENTPSIGQTLALTQAECLCLTGVLQCVKTDRPGACSQGVVRVGSGGGGGGRGRQTETYRINLFTSGCFPSVTEPTMNRDGAANAAFGTEHTKPL